MYSPAAAAMIEHRYGAGVEVCPCGRPVPCGPGAGRGLGRGPGRGRGRGPWWYGSLPVQGTGAVELRPSVAAGIDTGTVQLVPLSPEPGLSGSAEEGIEAGFLEFMKEFSRRGR